MVPTLVENFLRTFCYLCLKMIMTGEPTHTTSVNGATRPSYINYRLKSEASITLCCQLCSTCYTVV